MRVISGAAASPVISWVTLSPNFRGIILDSNHLRLSTRSRDRCTFSWSGTHQPLAFHPIVRAVVADLQDFLGQQLAAQLHRARVLYGELSVGPYPVRYRAGAFDLQFSARPGATSSPRRSARQMRSAFSGVRSFGRLVITPHSFGSPRGF